MNRCPRCGGAILGDTCINCGWEVPTPEEAEAEEVKKTAPKHAPHRSNVDRERQAVNESTRRKKYHKNYQSKHSDKVKEWHKASYERQKVVRDAAKKLLEERNERATTDS